MIRNNLFYQPKTSALSTGSRTFTNVVVSDNLTTAPMMSDTAQAGLVETNNLLSVDPRVLDAGGYDFRLLPASLAINAGATLGEVPYDFAGCARPRGVAYDNYFARPMPQPEVLAWIARP